VREAGRHDTHGKTSLHEVLFHEKSWAMLQEVSSYGVFRVGAQVRDGSGRWASLEIDLKNLEGLPRRFLVALRAMREAANRSRGELAVASARTR
jgi:hypothetical protein